MQIKEDEIGSPYNTQHTLNIDTAYSIYLVLVCKCSDNQQRVKKKEK